MLDVVLKEFPQSEKGIYLDTAATSLKPFSVVNALANFYQYQNATIHRAAYRLSQNASEKYFETRNAVKSFINAKNHNEIVFTKNATDAINLVARSFGSTFVEGDEILLTTMEHHANLVSWQILAKDKKLHLKFIPANEKGELIISEFEKLLTPKVKLVSLAHISNVTGTCHPVKLIIDKAHMMNAKVLIDGAQAIGHIKIDVTNLDVDFYCFSAHKAYGPYGVGVLYGKAELLEIMPPINGGGDMIDDVNLTYSTYQKAPLKFEAGTPAIAEIIAFHEAIKFMEKIGLDNISAHESKLTQRLLRNLSEIDGLKFIGKSNTRKSIVTFTLEGVHPLDLATFLDLKQISIRTGHLCAKPYLKTLNLDSVARASIGIYNTLDQMDQFADAILNILKKLAAY
jgi:cysteine desulfurase / selenocysteine lyase